MHAGEHRREHKIGIGVRARRAMFDAARVDGPIGMRKPAERLLTPQWRLTGANMSGWKRR